MSFDPVVAAESLANAYQAYLASTLRFENPDLQQQFQEQMLQRGALSKGPLLEATPPYTTGASIDDLIGEGVLCDGLRSLAPALPAARPLYSHQESAIRNVYEGRNQVIVTGTGSGKTESFLIPVFDSLLREKAAGTLGPGVRALILYPMNALANDQLKRMRELLVDVPDITFGRYTGETKNSRRDAIKHWGIQHPGGAQPLPNEILSREEIRENPPHILLTNYAMLEYLLLRPADAPLFSALLASNWSHIVVDEAHVYSGTLGTEIAYLLRRLKARLSVEPGRLRCFATSATIGSSEDDFRQVARFASDLFGEPFSDGEDGPLDVVTSTPDEPSKEFKDLWGRLSADDWHELAEALRDEERSVASRLLPVLARITPHLTVTDETWPSVLGDLLLGEATTQELIVRLCTRRPLDLSDASDVDWTPQPIDSRALSAVVDVLSRCERDGGMQLLSARFHSFFRAPEGAFVSLLDPPVLSLTRRTAADTDVGTVPVYEVSTCRHCGQEYLLGHRERPERGPDGHTVERLSPEPPRESEDTEVPAVYYMLVLESGEGDLEVDDDQGETEESAYVDDLMWLCPVCGTLHDSPDSATGHAHAHEQVRMVAVRETKAKGDKRPCVRCGYQSANALQRVRVSPEAAGSVMVYDLIRALPPVEEQLIEEDEEDPWGTPEAVDDKPNAGSLICFSDRRQDAAFFAPSLERTYNAVLRRQVLYQAAKAIGEERFTPSDWANKTTSLITTHKYLGHRASDVEIKKTAWAWVLTEMMSEDTRASLEGLGLVRYSVRGLEDLVLGPLMQAPWNLNSAEVLALVDRLIDTLRDKQAIQWQAGITGSDGLMPERLHQTWFIKQRDRETSKYDKSWLAPSHRPSASNARIDFALKLLQSRAPDCESGRQAVGEMLSKVWEHVVWGRLGGRQLIHTQGNEADGKLRAHPDLWEVHFSPTEGFARCDQCGRLVVGSTLDICPAHRCKGRLVAVDPESDPVDVFYRDLFRSDEPVPIEIEEHTAQLQTEHAAHIQEKFLQGKVNVLSCTTTFELGVDVGDLRSVFMRNVPPSPANYVQRAGRTGRRAGVPGFALTFARLRSHDLAFYQQPELMIAGSIPPPSCYLENEKIAERHQYAIALSAFYRASEGNEVFCGDVEHFFAPDQDEAPGMRALRDYLAGKPEDVLRASQQVFSWEIADTLGISEWRWVDGLVGDTGRITSADHSIRQDWEDLDEVFRRLTEAGNSRVGNVMNAKNRIRRDQVINRLASYGALPKYGFPTDLVELSLPRDAKEADYLEMQRGLRTAIYEYAPGSEVVAAKRPWKSVALRKIPGKTWDAHSYWACNECGHFQTKISIGDQAGSAECPVCGTDMGFGDTFLVPEFGFVAKEASKKVGERRPRASGGARTFYARPASVEAIETRLPGGVVEVSYSRNGRLYSINRGPMGRGFKVCYGCGGAGPVTDLEVKHLRSNCSAHMTGGQHLGTWFETDVLELVLKPSDPSREGWIDWNEVPSTLWACVLSAAEQLVIPEAELGGTAYQLPGGHIALLLFDDVPGGAGRVQSLSRQIEPLFISARARVDGRCGCGEETSCYSCLRSYKNQFIHDRLSRRGAISVLDMVLVP